MKPYVILLAVCAIYISCKDINHNQNILKTSRNDKATIEPHQPTNALITSFDTLLHPFKDSNYLVEFHVFDAQERDHRNKNAIIKLFREEDGNKRTLKLDSIYCLDWSIILRDFNNDKVKDILLTDDVGGRANVSYHLYIVDDKTKTIQSVNGFEKLVNPEVDTEDNIIVSIGMAGPVGVHYSFYRIKKKDQLVDLGHSFWDNPNDSTLYPNAIKQINRHR